MDSDNLVAVVSVSATAIVSILAVLLPKLFDWLARREERRAVQSQAINAAALNFLTYLAYFQHWEMKDIELASGDTALRAYSVLRERHFAWERAIWSKLTFLDRSDVRQIRERIMEVHTPDDLTKSADESDVPALADAILDLTYRAVDRPSEETWWERVKDHFR